MKAMVEISFMVVVPTVVPSRVDIPVLVELEVVARVEVVVAVAQGEEMSCTDVLRVTADVVAGDWPLPGAGEDDPPRNMVGDSVISVAVVEIMAAVNAPAGMERTAVVVSAAALVIAALVEKRVDVDSR